MLGTLALLVSASLPLAPATARADSNPGFWPAVAAPADGAAGRLLGEAATSRGADLAAAAERLQRILALQPGNVTVRLALGEVEARRGRDAAAIEAFEALLTKGSGTEEAAVWARLAGLRVKLGRYGEAAAAYEAAIAAGPASADLFANLGELLMADGRLEEAEARYRDAVAAASAEITGERRPRAQDLALAYYGLGVALDRDGQKTAAREMVGRALALDPGASLLKMAAMSGGELTFVPDGDVYYYVGLAAEAEGHAVDAEAAFREYVARRRDDRWAAVTATHLPTGQPSAVAAERGANDRRGGGRGRGPRVVAFGTVESAGGIAAPLVDAAWRAQPGLLEDCLGRAAGAGSVRISLEMSLDGRGRVTRATVKAPGLGEPFARCAEAAIKDRLVIAAPARAKATSVRTDLIIAFP